MIVHAIYHLVTLLMLIAPVVADRTDETVRRCNDALQFLHDKTLGPSYPDRRPAAGIDGGNFSGALIGDDDHRCRSP